MERKAARELARSALSPLTRELPGVRPSNRELMCYSVAIGGVTIAAYLYAKNKRSKFPFTLDFVEDGGITSIRGVFDSIGDRVSFPLRGSLVPTVPSEVVSRFESVVGQVKELRKDTSE